MTDRWGQRGTTNRASVADPRITQAGDQRGAGDPTVLRPPFVVAALFLVFFAVVAVRLGTDATPDFRIYHYYNGFAALHDRTGLDVAPAQLQSMLFKAVDAVYYALFRLLGPYPAAINVLLSLPYALAAVFAFSLSQIFCRGPVLLRIVLCSAAALFGITGAGELPTLATTMTDVVPSLPVLIAMTYWFKTERAGKTTLATTALAGLLAGAAVGLKLTVVPVFIGVFVAIAIRRFFGVRGAFLQAAVFGCVGFIIFLAIDATWLLHNAQVYGNPIFPNLNNVFKSDYADHGAWADTRFLPKTPLMAIFYPVYWAFGDSTDTIELTMRDARILIGCVSALIILAIALYRGVADRRIKPAGVATERLAVFLAVTYLIAYALWEMEWSIYRYLAVEELLSGVILLAALRMALRSAPGYVSAVVFTLIALPAAASTHYPWWSRAQPAAQAVSVTLPAVEADAMVVLLDPYAYSYLVPSMPRTVRVIGANNNIIRPGAWGKLEAEAEAAINGHHGPFWGMEFPVAFPGSAETVLTFYHLKRDEPSCSIVQSNIEDGPHIRMCRLLRNQSQDR